MLSSEGSFEPQVLALEVGTLHLSSVEARAAARAMGFGGWGLAGRDAGLRWPSRPSKPGELTQPAMGADLRLVKES